VQYAPQSPSIGARSRYAWCMYCQYDGGPAEVGERAVDRRGCHRIDLASTIHVLGNGEIA
jgi:hypothetical protein